MTKTTIGAGTNSLVLRVSQDAYLGNALYGLSVDGVPVDGTLTASSLHAAGQYDLVTVLGNFGLGSHSLGVTFLNDAYAGTPTTDRNLYVDAVIVDGSLLPGSSRTLLSAGTVTVGFTESGPPTPAVTSIGSGNDALLLKISQDFYLENARYTVSVDGVQVDGTLTARAWHDSGQDDLLTVRGNFAPGTHSVAVNFLNDAWDGTSSTDRNLYVDGISINGHPVANSSAELLSPGPRSFSFTETAGGIDRTIGSGSDSLVLLISEDFYVDNAQYTIRVDGVQVDGTLNAGAWHIAGFHDTLTVKGDWGPGPHTVTVNFLNDLYNGTPQLDRNLYVDGISYNGVPQPGGTAALFSAGPRSFGFTDTGAPLPVQNSYGSGPDALVLKLSQDFYQGNAQYSVSLDGVPVDGVQTASAWHSAGQDDTLTIRGDFSAGQHSVRVNFLNDAYAGTPSTDRNLYVDGITLNGNPVSDSIAALFSPGPHDFNFLA